MNATIYGIIAGVLLTLGTGLYLKGRHDGKASVIAKQERVALKLKAEQDKGLADVMTTYIFGAQDDAKLIGLIESAVNGMCPTADSAGVPKAVTRPAEVSRAAKISAAVKSDLAAGVRCHRQLSALIDAAVVSGASKP